MTTHNHDEIHNYEGLLPTSPSSNKRSLTNHLADYVKKTKYVAPHATQPPTDEPCVSSLQRESRSAASKVPAKKPIEQASKRGKSEHCSLRHASHIALHVPSGSLCIAYSISDDHQADNSILNIHGNASGKNTWPCVLCLSLSLTSSSPARQTIGIGECREYKTCVAIEHVREGNNDKMRVGAVAHPYPTILSGHLSSSIRAMLQDHSRHGFTRVRRNILHVS